MSKKKPVPKILWAAFVNLNGLITEKPVKCYNQGRSPFYGEDDEWWDKSGDYSVDGPGLECNGVCTTYASTSKTNVQIFIDGCNAMEEVLRNIISGGS